MYTTVREERESKIVEESVGPLLCSAGPIGMLSLTRHSSIQCSPQCRFIREINTQRSELGVSLLALFLRACSLPLSLTRPRPHYSSHGHCTWGTGLTVPLLQEL